RCGGAGGPACAAGQTCDLVATKCVGGDRCFNRTCPAGTACDPEDGECHCGDSGAVCGANQACEVTSSAHTCRTTCDPVAQTPCGAGEGCGFNTTTKQSFCGPAGTQQEGSPC